MFLFFNSQDSYVLPQVQSTTGFHSDVPAVSFQEPIDYSTSDSSSSSPPQSGCITSANCPQKSPVPSPTTLMDSNRIINSNDILPNTGRNWNILLHSIRLLCPIHIFYSNTDSPCYYYPPENNITVLLSVL